MTLLGNLPPILKRRILQTPSDQATQVESTTRPSAFSVHKALPSRSLHSPASRDAQVGDVCLRFAWNLRRLNATIWCIVNNINNKQQNNYSRIALESSHLQMSGTRSICSAAEPIQQAQKIAIQNCWASSCTKSFTKETFSGSCSCELQLFLTVNLGHISLGKAAAVFMHVLRCYAI